MHLGIEAAVLEATGTTGGFGSVTGLVVSVAVRFRIAGNHFVTMAVEAVVILTVSLPLLSVPRLLLVDLLCVHSSSIHFPGSIFLGL